MLKSVHLRFFRRHAIGRMRPQQTRSQISRRIIRIIRRKCKVNQVPLTFMIEMIGDVLQYLIIPNECLVGMVCTGLCRTHVSCVDMADINVVVVG